MLKYSKITVWGGPSITFFEELNKFVLQKPFTRIQKIDFFIVSDVMETDATNIKTNTAHFIAMKYTDTEKWLQTLQSREL